MKIMLKLQFLTCKKYSEHRSKVKNCNFSKLQFFKCTSTVIPLHIFAVKFKKYKTCDSKVLLYIDIVWRCPLIGSLSKDGLLSDSAMGFSNLRRKLF